ncbi:TIGR01212 family radical SAM protein [Natroniella acetigena]|uniref:TIGR01212 family radical SAM protein n=1 Tax=Natroniella acetigena TaxID=52004 RepID=UPI00200B93E6|nr:TIGR01212 family radical SAM protein [Natroniella acetigena]MCK8826795.1 TIGR01212 family radical SAM protein [Natroniella acetigena]
MKKYYRYSDYLKHKYGTRTYKIPINLALTCPNRDGNIAEGGCIYCGEGGASFSEDQEVSMDEVLHKKERIAEKYRAEKFIAYFQNFTNTYLPLDQLLNNIEQVLGIDEIVEIALATRPDCISQDYIAQIMKLIEESTSEPTLTFELGLQSTNYHTLEAINRGHTLAEFIDAVLTAHQYNAEIGVHIILNLPGDDKFDAREAAKIVSALKVENVKLHALYIREDTQLAQQYQQGQLEMISLAEYIDRVIEFLEYLDPKIAVQRLIGKAPREGTLFINWDYNYDQINNFILEEMERRDSWQGKKFDYLDGKALAKL